MKDDWYTNNLAKILNLCGNSFARYSEECSTQIYRALYGDAMLVPMQMGTNMAAFKWQKHLALSSAIETR